MTAYTRVPVEPERNELAPGTTVGEFEVVHKLGHGGMGTVYGAVHPVIGKKGAIKVLRRELCTDQKEVARFVQEARAVNQIGHPNIVDVFSFGTLADGRSYLIMEWLTGSSLRARLERGPLSRREIVDIAGDIIRALEATHAQKIIHRDLKPDNVFLVDVPGERPRAKLLDFGVAKLTAESFSGGQTRAGAMLGTPQYIAPEQARGEPDTRSDIYALGVLLFELIAGRPPFIGETTTDVVSQHLLEDAPALSSCADKISPRLDALFAAMLSKEPDERPSLRRVQSDLQELLGKSDPLRTATRAQIAGGRKSSTGLKIGLALLLGAAAATIAFLVVSSSNKREPVAVASGSAPVQRESPPPPPPPPKPVKQEVVPVDAAVEPAAPEVDPQIGHVVIHAPQKGIKLTANGVTVDAETRIPLPWGKAEIMGTYRGQTKRELIIVEAGKTLDVHIEVKTRAPSKGRPGKEPVVDDPLNNGIR